MNEGCGWCSQEKWKPVRARSTVCWVGTGSRTGRGVKPGPSCGHLSGGGGRQGTSLYSGFLRLITAHLGHLPPASLTLGLVELQGTSAGQSDFGPGMRRTGCAEYNQRNLGTILYFIFLDRYAFMLPGQAWASCLTFLSLAASLNKTDAKAASLVKH